MFILSNFMQKWELFVKIKKESVKSLSNNDYEVLKLKTLILYPSPSIASAYGINQRSLKFIREVSAVGPVYKKLWNIR